MTKNKDLLTKVTEVTTLTPSQVERAEIDRLKSLNILKFIEAQLTKIEAKQSFKQKVVDKLTDMLDSNDPEVSFVGLIKLVEVLEKGDNDLLGNLLTYIKGESSSQELEDNQSNASGVQVTASDMDKVKKIISLVDKLNVTEGK